MLSTKNINTIYSGYNHECSKDNPVPVVQSALIKSKNSFAFKYGVIEIRAKVPAGDWLWPTISLLPKINAYGDWPRSGSIDLMESRGNENLYETDGQNIGTEQFRYNLHYGNEGFSVYLNNRFLEQSPKGIGWNKRFHTYRMEWAPRK